MKSRAEWIVACCAGLTLIVVIAGGIYTLGSLHQIIQDNHRAALKVDEMAERLARIEGYLAYQNGVTKLSITE